MPKTIFATLVSLFVVTLTHFASADTHLVSRAQNEESATDDFLAKLRSNGSIGDITADERAQKSIVPDEACDNVRCLSLQEIRMNALTTYYLEDKKNRRRTVLKEIKRLKKLDLPLDERLQLYALLRELGQNNLIWQYQLYAEVRSSIEHNTLSDKAAYTIVTDDKAFNDVLFKEIKNKIARNVELPFEAPATDKLRFARDLVRVEPDIKRYDSGKFANAPRLYMFCRSNPSFPCLFILKNKDGKFQRRADGEYWHQPALGYSGHNKRYNQRNGNTPRGVYRLDGVMPHANRQLDFGKYRRVILNFIGATKNETNMKYLLPYSSHTQTWWREAVVARDIGRDSLRIHGTGRMSKPGTNHYPLVSTSGCISQRERTYDKATYIDQRQVLDELMRAQGLVPEFDNESNISALLYVYNLDDKAAPMSLADLKAAGIL